MAPAPAKREQEMIKSAVSDSEELPEESAPEMPAQPMTQEYNEMEQSVMSPQAQPSAPEAEYQSYEQQMQQPEQDNNYSDQYGAAYQPIAISPDTMNEVAEQVVAEKLGPIAASLEKLFDQKSNSEAQIQYIDERLKRIEKIIDRLQLSILQKVGEYVTNVDDIKREMVETQKSFRALLDQKNSGFGKQPPKKEEF